MDSVKTHPFTGLAIILWVAASTYTLPLIGQGVLLILFGFTLVLHPAVSARTIKFALLLAIPPAISLMLFNGWIIPKQTLFSAPDHQGLLIGIKIAIRIALLIFAGLFFIQIATPDRLMAAMGQAGFSTKSCYLLVSPLLLVTRINVHIQQVKKAQQARGHNPKGHVIARLGSAITLILPVITMTLADLHQRALALDTRGLRSNNPRSVCFPCFDSPWQKRLRKGLVLLSLVQIIAYCWCSYGSS